MIRKGTYVLFLRFRHEVEAEVGSLGKVRLPAGDYCYVGSAMGGLDQRLSRHLSKEKMIRWHIDRFTVICDDMVAYESYPEAIPECSLAAVVVANGGIPVVKGFGCSDCSCETHLFAIDRVHLANVLGARGMTVFKDCRQAHDTTSAERLPKTY